ncbi:MAG TPA: OB-fold domain-containing protein [Thermoplasmata archaeon]|nr:OB-fold domain-containing protein [Thermoplasmata archaeon]
MPRASLTVPSTGTVLASTVVVYPATGWESPHRLALVEVSEGVRVLAIVEGDLPSRGSKMNVRADGATYRARIAPEGARGD